MTRRLPPALNYELLAWYLRRIGHATYHGVLGIGTFLLLIALILMAAVSDHPWLWSTVVVVGYALILPHFIKLFLDGPMPRPQGRIMRW